MRVRDPQAFRSQVEDANALAAAIQQLRLKHDPEYRKRYGEYLRGTLDARHVDGDETCAQWWERVTAK